MTTITPHVKKALVITMHKYTGVNFKYLESSVADQAAMLGFLQNSCSDFQIEAIHDGTAAAVSSKIDEFILHAKLFNEGQGNKKALFFLYYSGHGTMVNNACCGVAPNGDVFELESKLGQLSNDSVYAIAMLQCSRVESQKYTNFEASAIDSTGNFYMIYTAPPGSHSVSSAKGNASQATLSFIEKMKCTDLDFPECLYDWKEKAGNVEIVDFTAELIKFK